MMQESIEEIWEKEKRTVVFVTNNIEEALYIADRIILLSDARVRSVRNIRSISRARAILCRLNLCACARRSPSA